MTAPETDAIRARAKMWHLPPGIADSILALCDAQDSLCNALDEARAENERLRRALRPFSDAAHAYCDPDLDDDYAPRWAEFFTIGDFRRALAAMEADNATR